VEGPSERLQVLAVEARHAPASEEVIVSIETPCGKCGVEHDHRHGKCPVCGATKEESRRAVLKNVPKVPTKCPCCGFLLEICYRAYETMGKYRPGRMRETVKAWRRVYYCRFCKVSITLSRVPPQIEKKLMTTRRVSR
jgi:hypothetical protein